MSTGPRRSNCLLLLRLPGTRARLQPIGRTSPRRVLLPLRMPHEREQQVCLLKREQLNGARHSVHARSSSSSPLSRRSAARHLPLQSLAFLSLDSNRAPHCSHVRGTSGRAAMTLRPCSACQARPSSDPCHLAAAARAGPMLSRDRAIRSGAEACSRR